MGSTIEGLFLEYEIDRSTVGKEKDLIPDGKRRTDGRGRLRKDKREIFEGILWILKKGTHRWISRGSFVLPHCW
jgi:hypothetical protein